MDNGISLTPETNANTQMPKGLLGQLKNTIFKNSDDRNKIKRTIEIDASDKDAIESYKRGAIKYLEKRSPEAKYYEYVKPFTTIYGQIPPTVSYLHDLANIIMTLEIPGESKILDVACGAGWLSEFLFRYGYDVTGIDISEDLLKIANDRIEAIKFTPLGRDKSYIRFKKLDIEKESLSTYFDAIIFYDCLHHFSDIDGVFENAKKMLASGGKVLIKEGAMPPKGSDGEKELLRVFKEYNTLESPFDHDELKAYLKNIGFNDIKEYIEINGFFEKSSTELSRLTNRFVSPYDMNILICQMGKANLPDVNAVWRADISLKSHMESVEKSQKCLELTFNIKNIGDSTWKNDSDLKIGSVALGAKLYSPEGYLVEELLGRTPLPKIVYPGESVELTVHYPLSGFDVKGEYRLAFDLVLQGYFWFEQKGSKPLKITTHV